jgi:hypothetical protein
MPLITSAFISQGCLRDMARRVVLKGHLFEMARSGH